LSTAETAEVDIYNFSFVAVFIAVILPAAPTCVDAAEKAASDD